MITQALIYKKDSGKRSRDAVGFTELLEKVDKTWKKTQKDVASSMSAGTTVLTKLIRSRLKDNNEMSGRLKLIKKSLFKVSSDESGDFFRFRYEYDFPISTSQKRWQYGFFFADPKVKLGNVDAIRRWLKKKAAQGMEVYYVRKKKDGEGYEKVKPTKNWQWNAATFAVIKSRGGNSKYKPDRDWWKLDVRGKDRQVLEETLLSKHRHLIQYQFKKGWNNLPK